MLFLGGDEWPLFLFLWTLIQYMKRWWSNWGSISFSEWVCRFIGNGQYSLWATQDWKFWTRILCYCRCVSYLALCVCATWPHFRRIMLYCISYIQLLNYCFVIKKCNNILSIIFCHNDVFKHINYMYISNVYWTVHHCNSWRMKDQLDVTCYFISLLMCSTCFGH